MSGSTTYTLGKRRFKAVFSTDDEEALSFSLRLPASYPNTAFKRELVKLFKGMGFINIAGGFLTFDNQSQLKLEDIRSNAFTYKSILTPEEASMFRGVGFRLWCEGLKRAVRQWKMKPDAQMYLQPESRRVDARAHGPA